MIRHLQAILTSCVLAFATLAFCHRPASALPLRSAPGDGANRSGATCRSFGFMTEWPYDGDRGPAQGLAVDHRGDVFILSFRAFRYTSGGVLVNDWGPDWNISGEFDCPSGIAADTAGDVYVLDGCASTVCKFTASGVPIARWGTRGTGPGEFGYGLAGIATDDSGYVYVSDGGNCRIEKFTGDGEFVVQWGSPGTGPGEFVVPSTLAIDHDGHLFVADAGSPRIEEFRTSGEYVASWAIHADALAAGTGADLYALERAQSTVLHLDFAGHELDRWGGFGWEPGQFITPCCMAAQRDGSVRVADGDLWRVEQFGVADRWRITATAGPHGHIVPDTSVDVAEGMSRSYLAVPDSGYGVAQVKVDGAPVGSSAAYTFSNVSAPHTIDAGFAPITGWPTDPMLNLPVAGGDGWAGEPKVVPDGAGGLTLAWMNGRIVGTEWTLELRLQRIDAFGRLLWPKGGVCVRSSTEFLYIEGLVADGTGGGIVLWAAGPSAGNNRDLYLQRVDGAGVPRWTPAGVPVCPDPYNQDHAGMVSDGAGGVIVAWTVNVNGSASRLVAQRVDASGNALWGSDGRTCREHNSLGHSMLAPAGAGSAIVTWCEYGSASGLSAQRLGGDGALQWNPAGVSIRAAGTGLEVLAMVPDGSGGAIAVWQDMRGLSPDSIAWDPADLYAQRLDASGLTLWPADGVPVCTALGNKRNVVSVADSDGGAFVAWDNEWLGDEPSMQHLSAAGRPLWPANGQALGATGLQKWIGALVPDGAGGVIATWTEAHGASFEILAQRFDANGATRWPHEGVVVCAARGRRYGIAAAGDGFHGAIASWADGRDWYSAVFAQRMDQGGNLGGAAAVAVPPRGPMAELRLDRVAPNPHIAGPLGVRFSLESRAPARLEVIDLAGRRVAARELIGLEAGRRSIVLPEVSRLAPGLYFLRLEQDGAACTRRIVILR